MGELFDLATFTEDYYFFFYNNPDIYYYGLSLSVSVVILFMGDWDEDGGKKLSGVLLYRAKRIFIGLCVLFVLFVPFSLLLISENFYGKSHFNYWIEMFTGGILRSIYIIVLFPMFAVWLKVILNRFVYPWFSSLRFRTRVRQSKSALSDVRVVSNSIKQSNIDPRTQYKNENIFIGMTVEDKPVRVNYEEWKTKHMRIISPTTTGKGVIIGTMLDQAIRLGSLPVFIDGKPDRHGLPIMRKACSEVGRPLVEINFCEDSNYSYEPFLSGSEYEIKQRLWLVLDLSDSGNMADFYKKAERLYISNYIRRGWDGHVESLLKYLRSSSDIDTKGSQEILAEFLDISAVKSNKNMIDIDDLLASNAVIYVRTSLDVAPIVKLTNCLIQNIVQSVKRQDLKGVVHRPIFVDEVRFFVSDTLADSLATIADFGANFVLTYQSLLDLLNVKDQRLNAKSIAQSINTNCLMTYVGQASDHETAEAFEKETGTIIKEIYDRIKVNTNAVGGDEFDGQAFLSQKDAPLVTANHFLTFPARVGVFINKPNVSAIVRTSFVPIDVTKHYDYDSPVYVEKTKIRKPSDIKPTANKARAKKEKNVMSLEDLDEALLEEQGEHQDYAVLFKNDLDENTN